MAFNNRDTKFKTMDGKSYNKNQGKDARSSSYKNNGKILKFTLRSNNPKLINTATFETVKKELIIKLSQELNNYTEDMVTSIERGECIDLKGMKPKLSYNGIRSVKTIKQGRENVDDPVDKLRFDAEKKQ